MVNYKKVYNKCIYRNYHKYQFYTDFHRNYNFYGRNFLFSFIEISKNHDY